MYSKNIIVRRNVKYRTVRIMEQVAGSSTCLRKKDWNHKERSIHQEEEIVISVHIPYNSGCGALCYEYGNQKCVL